MSLEDILQTLLTGYSTEVDIWEKLVDYLSENWDGQAIFQQVKDLSRKQLGGDVYHIKNTTQYFRALENNFSDKNDLLEFIINLTRFLNFHTECGSVNVPETLKTFRKTLRKFRELCIRRGIFRDKNFVGREAEIEKLKNEIRSNRKKGILICGMGGMGKTCLASTLCYELRSEDWKTTKIELREQRTFWHFLRTTMHNISDLRGSMLGYVYTAKSTEEDDMHNAPDEENIMKQKLIDYLIANKNRKQIYMFDNLDDVTSDRLEKDKILEFLKTLLKECKDQSQCKIRIIVTSRENFLLQSSDDLKQLMADIEVKSLDLGSAVELVRKCTEYGQTILTTEIMHSVVRVCGACPLAIRVVCGIINTSPLALIKNMERQAESLSSSFLQIKHCLQQPYERLEEYKQILCKLSLFGTAKFDLHSATIVVFGKKSKEDELQCQEELQLILLLFKSRHLLEIDNYYRQERGDNDVDPERTDDSSYMKIFSHHPLVYQFLKEKSNNEDMCQEMKKAKSNYIALFKELVCEIGEAYDTNVLLAREKSEKLKVHISKYIQLLEDLEDVSNEPSLENALSNEQITLLSKSVELIYNQEQHLSFLNKMCMKTEEDKITNCCWQVEHITAMVRYETPCNGIEEKCDKIIDQLNNFEADQLILIDKSRMFNNKGKITMEIGDGRNSLYIFQKGIDILKSKCLNHTKKCQKYLADIYNSVGCVYYRTAETGESIKWHTQALNIMYKNKLYNESGITFCANLGACHFRLGIEHNRNKDKTKTKAEMEKALKYYDESITLAKHFKAEITYNYAKKLKNRGDVFAMLRRFDESEKDYQIGLEVERKLHSSPNRREILLQHARGDIVRLQIKDMHVKRRRGSLPYREDDEDTDDEITLSLKGLQIYEELMAVINVDMLPTDSFYYNKIKRNHLYFLKLLNEEQKRIETEMFYQNYEAGKSPLSSSFEDSSSSSSDGSNDTEDVGNEPSSRDHHIENNQEKNNSIEDDGYKTSREDDNPSCIQKGSKAKEKDDYESSCQNENAITKQAKCINPSQSKTSESSSDNLNKDETHKLENDHTSDIARDEREAYSGRINEKKQNFKLPLTSSSKFLQSSLESPCIGLPKKISTRRGSSSSSGVSSLGTMTPDSDRLSIRSARCSRELSQEKSFEDEVFGQGQLTVDVRKERLADPGWVKRRASFQSFGSGSLSYDCEEHPIAKQPKFNTRPLMTKSASLDAIGTTTPRKQDWIMKDKLSSWFEDTTKSSQTDIGTLDSIVDDIEALIPSTKQRMRTLLHKLDTDKAQLIDDQKGRPIVQYVDEGFQNETEIKE